MKYYVYGLRYRPKGIGCQPSGFVCYLDRVIDRWVKDSHIDISDYYDLVAYRKELDDVEINKYELEFIGEVEE